LVVFSRLPHAADLVSRVGGLYDSWRKLPLLPGARVLSPNHFEKEREMSHLAHTVRRSPRRTRIAASLILLLLAALALVWIGRAAAEEGEPSNPDVATSASNVATSKADGVDATLIECTNSDTFVDMPSMSERFSFGGNASRPVLVLFQATWMNGPNGHAVIRLLIDGVVQPGAGQGVTVHNDDGTSSDQETNGFNFISAPLGPGTHRAKIQWFRVQGGICVSQRSLIVLHK
jgi:hypothetical protein